MRRVSLLVLVLWPSLARGEQVETVRSYWDEERTTIYSDVRVTHDDGRVEVVRELGGSVDGIAMLQVALYARTPERAPYVRTLNKTGARLHWAGSWVHLTPDAAGTSDVTGEQEHEALRAAADAWNGSVEGCSYVRFVLKPPESLEVGLDGKNTIKFRADRWCRPARGDDPEKCYDRGATAITTLFIVDRASRSDNGLILDTDVEVNTVNFAMATGCETRCVTAGAGQVEDLQNTLSHELGHVLGLDHTCFVPDPSNPGRPTPLDDSGAPAPSCDLGAMLAAEIRDATMYNYQEPMEVKKRTPEPDDVEGVCAAYPTADDPMLYDEVHIDEGGGCCAVAGGSPRRGRDWGAVFLALLVVVLRARACSRSRRP